VIGLSADEVKNLDGCELARHGHRNAPGDAREENVVTNEIAPLGDLTAEESELCAFHDRKFAEQRREELRAHYSFAQAVRNHRSASEATRGCLRASLERCCTVIGKNRSTLVRYANIALRIKPDEFERLLTLSDARGYPIAFWDLVEVAALSMAQRQSELIERLSRRPTASVGTPRLREGGEQASVQEAGEGFLRESAYSRSPRCATDDDTPSAGSACGDV
jgi:hypothetical protein